MARELTVNDIETIQKNLSDLNTAFGEDWLVPAKAQLESAIEFYKGEQHETMMVSVNGIKDAGMRVVDEQGKTISDNFNAWISLLDVSFRESAKRMQESQDSTSQVASKIEPVKAIKMP